ncbi:MULTISPECIES: TSUP family transporter [Halomonas]|uniref:TSUP family transporter n=1 Tax=Halomonas TaxID=2745 RepID=UPI001A8C0E94|nr:MULTISPECIES: TSUP family transporter [Halomonas]MED5295002.1 TSUP family transporter [Pseudomonadota bacterium]MBN8413227.1 TSUP family transporter [Halomonas litopenaei]MBY5928369.1 TSUP family transporter [Halomonas sp. DP8Y7-3]MBY6208880.1 TSUP family transporter [Halomonas sp. DP3Y7-2]MBY6227350.1 TSUP family transporter [Halomonas sp. DP3Y7-1]
MTLVPEGMALSSLAAVVSITLLAGYLHTVAGFGIGMIIIGVASGLELVSVATLVAVVSLITLVNSAVALPGKLHHLDGRHVLALGLGIVPSIGLGVWALNWLSVSAEALLMLMLGALVFYGGLSVGLRPRPRAQVSAPAGFAVSGAMTGLLGGMFGMPGPPVIYHCYRQPLPRETIRLLLIACFAMTSGVRTLYVGAGGGLDAQVWLLALWTLPAAALATWAGRRYPPPCSAELLRRVAMLTLMIIGTGLVIDGAMALWQY